MVCKVTFGKQRESCKWQFISTYSQLFSGSVQIFRVITPRRNKTAEDDGIAKRRLLHLKYKDTAELLFKIDHTSNEHVATFDTPVTLICTIGPRTLFILHLASFVMTYL